MLEIVVVSLDLLKCLSVFLKLNICVEGENARMLDFLTYYNAFFDIPAYFSEMEKFRKTMCYPQSYIADTETFKCLLCALESYLQTFCPFEVMNIDCVIGEFITNCIKTEAIVINHKSEEE